MRKLACNIDIYIAVLQTSDRKVCHRFAGVSGRVAVLWQAVWICLILYSSCYSAVCQYYSADGLIIFMPGSDSNGLQGFAGVTAKKAGNWLCTPPGWNSVCCVSVKLLMWQWSECFSLCISKYLYSQLFYLETESNLSFPCCSENVTILSLTFQGLFVQMH